MIEIAGLSKWYRGPRGTRFTAVAAPYISMGVINWK